MNKDVIERSKAQLRERIAQGEAENADRRIQASKRSLGLPMTKLVVPQNAQEAEALQAEEAYSGSQLVAPSKAREVLDEQRAETYRNSRTRREDARRHEHFMFGADGVRPKALAERCEAERMEAEKALQDSLTASSSTAKAAASSGSSQQASIFDDNYDNQTRKYVQDLRDWFHS